MQPAHPGILQGQKGSRWEEDIEKKRISRYVCSWVSDVILSDQGFRPALLTQNCIDSAEKRLEQWKDGGEGLVRCCPTTFLLVSSL